MAASFSPQGGDLWAFSCFSNAFKANHNPSLGLWRHKELKQWPPTHLLALRDDHWSYRLPQSHLTPTSFSNWDAAATLHLATRGRHAITTTLAIRPYPSL